MYIPRKKSPPTTEKSKTRSFSPRSVFSHLQNFKVIGFIIFFVLIGVFWIFSAHAEQTVTVPASIQADCSVDVANRLQDWLQALPANVVVNMPQNACYKTENSIRLNSKTGLTINGNNTTLTRTIYGGDNHGLIHVTLSGCSNIVIRDLNILGRKPEDQGYQAAPEGQHGVSINGSTNIVLDHLSIKHVYGDFVYIGARGNYLSKNIVIRNSLMEDSGRQGISVVGGDTISITGNDISGNNRSTFDLEPNVSTDGALNVTIANNRIGHGKNYFLASLGGTPKIRNLLVANNDLYGRGMSVIIEPPPKQRRGPVTFIGNHTTRGGDRTLISMERIDGVLIKDNTLAVGGSSPNGYPVNNMTHVSDVSNIKSINNHTTNAINSLVVKDSTNYCELNNVPTSKNIPRCDQVPDFPTNVPPSSSGDDNTGSGPEPGAVSETQLPTIVDDQDPNNTSEAAIASLSSKTLPPSPSPTAPLSASSPTTSADTTSTNVPASSLVASSLATRTYKGTVTLTPPLAPANTTSVSFFLDDKLIETETKSPYSLTFNTKKYKNGSHTLTIKYNQSDGQTTTIKSTILIENIRWYTRLYRNVTGWFGRGYMSLKNSFSH